MIKSKKVFVTLLCILTALCLTVCVFMGISATNMVFAETGHDHNTWSVWGDDDGEKTSLPGTAGDYVLTSDITLSSTWQVPAGTDADNIAVTNLCLNGFVIKLANDSTGNVIKVLQNATLNLYDCGTTSHNGYVNEDGLWHLGTGEGTAKAITGGIITGGNNQEVNGNGGGVQVDKGVFNMYGGNIVGNYASNGAGVQVSSATDGVIASFKMSGGIISYNNAKNGGGGVSISNKNVVFNMTGGEITNNVVNSNYGGGVFTQSDITLGGTAQITGNTAKGTANNVYLFNGKTITLGTDNDAPTTMNIGVTLPNKVKQFTTAGTASDYSSNFFSDSDSYKVCFNDENEGSEYLELRTAYVITNNTKEDNKETNHGYIVVDNNAVEGEKVVVTVVANSGYELSSLKYNDGTDNNDITATDGIYSFTMPAKEVSITATFVVEKQTISISDEKYHCTYNGEPRAFQITSGEGPMLTGFKFEYYVDDDWTESAPKNAGSYNVKITRPEDDTYKAYEKVIEGGLVIEKAEVEVPTIASKTYVGNTGYALTADVETSELYEVTENNGGINAGKYDVKLTLIDSVNYKWKTSNDAEITLKFIIDYAKINKVGFGDVAQPVATETAPTTVSGIAIGSRYAGTISWSPALNDGDFDYDTTYTVTITLDIVPSSIDNYRFADNFTLVKPTGEGWTKSSSSTDSKLIYTKTFEKTGKIPQVVEITNDISKTYDATEVSAPTYTKLGEGTVTVEYKLATEEDTAYKTTAPINAGSYVVRVSVAETETHSSGFTTKAFTISPKAITVTVSEKTSVYGDNTVSLTATDNGIVSGDENVYSLSTTATSTTSVGTYNITGTALDDNYSITFENEENAYTITQREVTIIWGETTFAYNNQQQLPTVTAGNLANSDKVTVTVVPNKESVNVGEYVATATTLSNDNYKLAETNLTTNFVINKADYDMTSITFADKTVKTTDSLEDKKLAISGTLPTGLDGVQLSVSYVDNDNTERGVYTVTAKFSTTSTNYNTPSDMTAVLTILWVRDSEKESGSDNEFVIVTSETGIDPTLTLKVDVVKIDNSDSQYKEVADSIKKEDSFNANLDKIFGVYDVSLIDQNDVKVQPDGTIKVYMTIPEEIKNCEFRIYHIHNGVASKADYVIDDGYAVIETDELSEFVFVYEQTSLLPWIIVLSIISALGLAGIVLLLVKNKKDKQGRE